MLSKITESKFIANQASANINPTYYRPFGATSDIGGAQCTPPISYACSTCAIVMKLSEIKQLDK